MLHRTLRVIINNLVVHEESVQADKTMMRGHQLKRIFCINNLLRNGIQAAVFYEGANDNIEVKDVQLDGDAMVVQSKMNDDSFNDSVDWFDDKIFKNV